jgi:adenylate cyclase
MGVVEVQLNRTMLAPIAQVWATMSNTDALNRSAGFGEVSFATQSSASAARLVGSARLVGLSVQYEELPFEWVEFQQFSVERRYQSGPLTLLRVSFAFDADGDTTRVVGRMAITPRLPLMGPLLRFQARNTLAALFDSAAASLRAPPGSQVLPPPAGSPLERARSRLLLDADLTAAEVDRLVDWIRTAPLHEVARIRPYALAASWGVSRGRAIDLCLAAVRAGMLTLRWDVVCPGCRGASTSVALLADLAEHGSCNTCELTFDLAAEERVEAVFLPPAAIRDTEIGPWCSGGPARQPHVVAQSVVGSGERIDFTVPEAPGRLRIFLRGGPSWPVWVEAGAPLDVVGGAPGELVRVAPGGRVSVPNGLPGERHARLERLVWASQAATLADLCIHPRFRRDFPDQVLSESLRLDVGHVALLFTDLTDSTRLYASEGDGPAWSLVKAHFDALFGVITAHGGTVVKTMGDAVMAAFSEDSAAVRASLGLLAVMDDFRRDHPAAPPLTIKVGVHAGPCVIVRANESNDYFGQTVNLAARLQSKAGPSEVVASASIWQAAADAVAVPVQASPAVAVQLKGVVEPVSVVTLTLPRGSGGSEAAVKVNAPGKIRA